MIKRQTKIADKARAMFADAKQAAFILLLIVSGLALASLLVGAVFIATAIGAAILFILVLAMLVSALFGGVEVKIERSNKEDADKNALRDDFGPSETTSGTVRLIRTGELAATPFAVLRITDRKNLPDIDVVALGQHNIDRFSRADSSVHHSCKRVPRYFVDNLPVVTFCDASVAAAT